MSDDLRLKYGLLAVVAIYYYRVTKVHVLGKSIGIHKAVFEEGLGINSSPRNFSYIVNEFNL